jgi:hypothetical protein
MNAIVTEDKEFLLRCANTYNWETLIDFCRVLLDVLTSSPSSSLISSDQNDDEIHDEDGPQPNDTLGISHHARSCCHQQERMLLRKAAKEQLTRTDQWGNNCLHASCYNTSPLEVVASILRCAAAASVQLHKTVSRDLSTPLSIACATGATVDVIRALLHPSWAICRNGGSDELSGRLEDGGGVVFMADDQGCTPLSELTINYELQRKAPWHLRTAKPLEEVQWIFGDHGDHPTTVPHTHGTTSTVSTPHYSDEHRPLFECFWIKVEMLLRAAWAAGDVGLALEGANSSPSRRPRPWISLLHGAAYAGGTCPEVLTSLICRMFSCTNLIDRPISPTRKVRPLHLAVTGHRPTEVEQQAHSILGRKVPFIPILRRRAFWIKALLDLDPSDARALCNGRSVLCQAIESGFHWHAMENFTGLREGTVTQLHGNDEFCSNQISTFNNDFSKMEPNMGSLYFIWKSYPNVLWRRDAQSGLFPFMLAACFIPYNDEEYESLLPGSEYADHHARQKLDTIFALLRLHPESLVNEQSRHTAAAAST